MDASFPFSADAGAAAVVAAILLASVACCGIPTVKRRQLNLDEGMMN